MLRSKSSSRSLFYFLVVPMVTVAVAMIIVVVAVVVMVAVVTIIARMVAAVATCFVVEVNFCESFR